jgi:lipopolysaccharide heptosyltransferase I
MPRIALEHPPRRILLVKPSALGDVVHALPIAALIKRTWPEARLTWLISRPFAPLLETNPHVDALLPFDRQRGRGWWRHSGNVKRLAGQLRDGHFDLVIDLQGLLRSAWLAWQTRAPVRVGFRYARELAPFFYTHHVDVPPGERHAVERYLDVAEALGLPRGPIEFPLPTTPQDEATAAALLAPLAGAPYALMLPGTNWPTKRWPAHHAATLAGRLNGETGLRIVLAGAADALEPAGVIRQANPAALDLVGKTSVRELVCLIRGASLVVSNDSGPMHLAAALGVPLVAPFGPTSPSRTGPYRRDGSVVRLDLVCSPCFSRHCTHQTCLQALEPDWVLARCCQELTRAAGGG